MTPAPVSGKEKHERSKGLHRPARLDNARSPAVHGRRHSSGDSRWMTSIAPVDASRSRGRRCDPVPHLPPLDWARREVLNLAIPWQIEFHGGLSRLDADLSVLELGSFEVTGGASGVAVTSPPFGHHCGSRLRRRQRREHPAPKASQRGSEWDAASANSLSTSSASAPSAERAPADNRLRQRGRPLRPGGNRRSQQALHRCHRDGAAELRCCGVGFGLPYLK